jgi:hypothetical protein
MVKDLFMVWPFVRGIAVDSADYERKPLASR